MIHQSSIVFLYDIISHKENALGKNFLFSATSIYSRICINTWSCVVGKSIPLPRGHAHLAVFMDEQDYNFTHRIDKLSFGDASPGVLHPLEGDEQIAEKSKLEIIFFLFYFVIHLLISLFYFLVFFYYFSLLSFFLLMSKC